MNMNFRRFSLTGESFTDAELDDTINNLYPSSKELEKRCQASLTRNSFVSAMAVNEEKAKNNRPHGNLNIVYEKSPEEVVEGLPAEYFQKEFDPVVGHLEEISSWHPDDLIQRFMLKIEETDTDKDVIIGHLTSMIDENYDDLMGCMTKIQEIDLELCHAVIEIKHARMKIQVASGVLADGSLKIKSLDKKKKELTNLSKTIQNLKSLTDIHKNMMLKINLGEVGEASSLAVQVLEMMKNYSFNKFDALKNIGDSMQKSIFSIRQKTDKALKRLCSRKFAPIEYEGIIRSYLYLDYIEETMNMSSVDNYDFDSNMHDSFYTDSSGCIQGLAQRINRFQLDDIDATLHSAVVEYIYVGQQKKQKIAAEVAVAGAYNIMNFNEIIDLAEVPLNLLYRRLTSDLIPPCIIRSCELLADIVHTHYLLTQWHISPFDPQNRDWKHLHQPRQLTKNSNENVKHPHEKARRDSFPETIVFEDEEEENDEEDDEAPIDLRSKNSRVNKLLQRKLHALNSGEISSDIAQTILNSFESSFNVSNGNCAIDGTPLVSAYQSLVHSRVVLWEEILRGLIGMLSNVNFASEVKLDEFVVMLSVLEQMKRLGSEFCGSESTALTNCIRDKTEEFLRNFHYESFQVVRMMTESEIWQNVPLEAYREINDHKTSANSSSNFNSILELLKSTASFDATLMAMVHGSDGKARSNSINKEAECTDPSQSPIRRTSTRRSFVVIPDEKPDNSSNSQSASETVVQSGTILENFATIGNPFHFMSAEEGNSGNSNGDDETRTSIDSNDQPQIDFSSKASLHSLDLSHLKSNMDKEFSTVDVISLIQQEIEEQQAKTLKRRASKEDFASSVNASSGINEVVTQAALNGLAKYCLKYLNMIAFVPSSAGEIFRNLSQLFDFYLSTVYYGFVPVEERNKFMATPTKMTSLAPEISRDFEALQLYLEKCLSDVIMFVNKNNTQSNSSSIVNAASAMLEQSISSAFGGVGDASEHSTNGSTISPISGSGHGNAINSTSSSHAHTGNTAPASSYEAVKLSSLLRIPQVIDQSEVTSCFGLSERVVAAESVCFVAKVLVELKPILKKLLTEDEFKKCENYISEYLVVSGQLRSLIYKAACPQLIGFTATLTNLLDSAWDSKKVREKHHDWVDRLVSSAEHVWEYMERFDRFADASSLLREQVWMEFCQSAFDLVLEGFSRVRKCSSEGRAMMTMDVFALHEGLNSIHLCRPPRGKHHVDNYLRAFYLAEEEMIQWIRENWQSYAYRHIHGLLTQTMSSLLNNKKFKDTVALVDNLYAFDAKENGSNSNMNAQNTAPSGASSSKLTSMLSTRFKEDGKISQLLNTKWR